MPDPIQANSSLPLPSYQTLQGTRDPLPLASPKAIDKSATGRVESDQDRKGDTFRDYLDQTSITVVERQQAKREADTVDLLTQNSVYGQPGISSPL